MGAPAGCADAASAPRRVGAWTVEHTAGAPGELLERDEPDPQRRSARIHTVTQPALVLGSAQAASVLDHALVDAAGIEVTRRRSGGGAVLLTPGGQVWVDFTIPAGDRLWHNDIARAALWAGELWARVAGRFCHEEPVVHRGGLQADRWGTLVCFAGVGPGEVSVSGAKVVGISQRRNRHRAVIQTIARVAPLTTPTATTPNAPCEPAPPDDEPLVAQKPIGEVDLLALTPAEREEARRVVAGRAHFINADAPAVVRALCDALALIH